MRSTFHGIETMKRALMATRTAMDVSSHNVGNAGTPGFSRQEVRLQATPQLVSSPLSLGTGVEIASVERRRSDFLEAQIRGESARLGYWEARGEVLQQIESLLAEPGEGLSSILDEFWEGWKELAAFPESMAARSSLRERSLSMLDAVNQLYRSMESWREEIADYTHNTVTHINAMAEEVARLNKTIAYMETTGDSPNDLLDARDQLLLEISELIGVSVHKSEDGQFYVSVGGVHLVDGDRARALEVHTQGDALAVKWEGLDREMTPTDGKLAGYISVREDLTHEVQADLTQMMDGLIAHVNDVHREGFGLDQETGRDFLDPAAVPGHWSLSEEVLGDLEVVAASLGGELGDGLNALEIADLESARILGRFTVGDYWRNMVVSLGVTTQEAQVAKQNQASLVQQLNHLQESKSGVSLDEEMVKMVQYQHAYGAAARMMTTMDEMLSTIMSIGVVGR